MASFAATIDAPVSREYRFDVTADGAKLDGSDDTAAYERALARALDLWMTKHQGAEVYTPPGKPMISRPLISPVPKLVFSGAGKYLTELAFGGGGVGNNLLVAADRTSGPSCPQYTSAIGGNALVQGITGNGQYVFDLAQYHGCRLTGSWSYRVVHGKTVRLPTTGEALSYLFFVGGQLYTGQDMYTTLLDLQVDYEGKVNCQFRCGGNVHTLLVRTASHPLFVPGEVNEFQVNWDVATRELRVFWNGELWLNGAWVPPIGNGKDVEHNAWERMCVGSGPAGTLSNDQAFSYYLPSAVRGIHLSNGVRNRTNYTPTYDDAVPDTQTRLALNFDRFYKGCAIAKGVGGLIDVYLYPLCVNAPETPQVHIRDIGFVGGFGVRSEFASQMCVERVCHQNPSDGWQLMRNGYFSAFRDVDIIGCVGRAAWMMGGDSYCGMHDIRVAGPIGYLMDQVNVEGGNLSASIHPGYSAGMVMSGGTNRAHFQVDAEETDPANAYLASLIVENPEAVKLDSATLYGPPGTVGKPAVIVAYAGGAAPTARLKFDSCSFYQEPTTPIVRTVGVTPAHPIVFDGCKNTYGAPLCTVPSNVVER